MLKPIAEAISRGISSSSSSRAIPFVKAGEQLGEGSRDACARSGLAALGGLGETAEFPHQIVSTTLGPDILFKNEITKNIIIMELTVP